MKTLQKSTLVDQVVTSVMQFIHDEKLPPGAALPSEVLMAEKLGVSRPVVREALRTLQGRSVLDLVNGKGAIIRPLDGKAFNEFFLRAMALSDDDMIIQLEESRNGMETQCAYLAALRRTDEHVTELGKVLAEMRESIEDKRGYWSLNVRFHKIIAQACGNRMLLLLVDSLQDAMDYSMEQNKGRVLKPTLWPAMHPYHEKIFASIRDKKAKAASDATAQHLDLALKITRG